MNKPNAMLIGWNRVVPGREGLAAELYQSFVGYFTKAQKDGKITGFTRTILTAHGGDMNGFFFVTGDYDKLQALRADEGFYNLNMEANTMLMGWGVVDGYANDASDQALKDWGSRVLPKLK
jgi:hypothetical protein